MIQKETPVGPWRNPSETQVKLKKTKEEPKTNQREKNQKGTKNETKWNQKKLKSIQKVTQVE